ncbi:ACT domain-containing protein [Nonomuraea sp. NPDC051941]|uniref:ACT domain-containing protein n=1 Tax=Nonomuraea sp. NPDC051941 TaxID=3364373 RepID=UPI0037CB852E
MSSQDLYALIKSMDPSLHEGTYVFAIIKGDIPGHLKPISMVREDEGTSIILHKAQAEEHEIPYVYPAAWITLRVHSSLETIGLTATISHHLAANGISCNIVAGYYHDHLFVPSDSGSMAIKILRKISLDPRQFIEDYLSVNTNGVNGFPAVPISISED